MSLSVSSGKSSRICWCDCPRRQPAEHVGNGNAHAADTGAPAALARFNRDDVLVVHHNAASGRTGK
jgi:hypothetical protein